MSREPWDPRERTPADERATLQRRVALQIAIPVALSTVGWFALVATRRPPFDDDASRVARMTAHGCTYDTRSDPGAQHVDEPRYTVDPPAGGDHRPHPASTGSYAAGDTPPDGDLVYALEHGIVVVWLGRGLAAADREPVRALYPAFPDVVIVVERRALPVPLAATAWGRRLLCPAGDVGAVREFVCTFNGRGPERVGPHITRGCPRNG